MAMEMHVFGEVGHMFLLVFLYTAVGVVSFTGSGEAGFPRGGVCLHVRLVSSLTWTGGRACAQGAPRRVRAQAPDSQGPVVRSLLGSSEKSGPQVMGGGRV